MVSRSDRPPATSARTALLEQLGSRLERCAELGAQARRFLAEGDDGGVRNATARLETLAQEFKVLAEEYRRLPDDDSGPDPGHLRAIRALETTATSLARSAALTGGLLERLIALTRALTATRGAALGPSYSPLGQPSDALPEGIRLKEWA